MHEYDASFYSFLDSFALRSAQLMVPVITSALPIASVADFGCGQGAWLSVWAAIGAEVLGIDGPYVARDRLLIDASAFKAADLTAPLELNRRFDLVQSLEVAEHLPRAHARRFIELLTHHADAVLFSAAVPGQGGEHHVNERPLEFWRHLFAAQGYKAVDVVRPAVRGDQAVQRWYRCNTMLYVNEPGEVRLSPEARACTVPENQPLENYWPAMDRVRHSVVRVLPVPVVDRLSHMNSALLARRSTLA